MKSIINLMDLLLRAFFITLFVLVLLDIVGLQLRLQEIHLLLKDLAESSCHQIPERCFTISGNSMAVCVRCVGVYAGATFSILFLTLTSHQVKHPWRVALLCMGIMVADWAREIVDLGGNIVWIRMITGAFGGIGTYICLHSFIKFIYVSYLMIVKRFPSNNPVVYRVSLKIRQT
jgi:uncharacterized membrane protein